MRKARLVDVAALAGVSMKTVSNVVNHYPYIRPETLQRVLAAIQELDYRPNASARRLVTGRTGTIAVALPELNVPYFAELGRVLADEAARHEYRVIFEQTIYGAKEERSVLLDRELGLVDGVIFHPTSPLLKLLGDIRPNVPMVLLGEGYAPSTIDRVMIDNVAAAREAVTFLLERGCTRVGFLWREHGSGTETSQQRIEGYSEALIAAGVPLDTDLVIPIDGYGAADGERGVAEALGKGLGFDALLCRDDILAVGAMRALKQHGLSVPGDVAVIGWDDMVLASFLTPSLTSVAPDKAAIAQVALRLLLERIQGHVGIGRHVIVPYELQARESTPRRM